MVPKKRRKKRENSKPQIENSLKFVKLPPEMSVKGFAENNKEKLSGCFFLNYSVWVQILMSIK